MTAAVPAVLGTILLLACCDAFGLCKFRPLRTVGDTATDSSCTDNNIQAAIDNAVGDPSCPTDIAITREHIWTSQHLSIAGKSLNFIGQADGITCSQVATCGLFSVCPTTAVTTLSASGFDRVLTISGSSNVTLHGLTITGGNSIGNGGGISFAGSGSLTLDATSISLNTASSGGGVDVNGSGGTASVYLLYNTLVIANTANGSGGGIRLSGDAQLYADAPQTLIGYNHALGAYGGGIQIVGPARAYIGSPGYGNGGVIFGNDAVYGGGVAINAGQNDGADALLRLFTTSAGSPVDVEQNFASSRGGGIYLKSYISFGLSGGSFADAVACLSNFRLRTNAAPDGPAIYADNDTDFTGLDNGSYVQMNRSLVDLAADEQCDPGTSAALGEVPCALGVACNEFTDNVAEDGNNQPTGGAVLFIGHEGELAADRLVMRHNNGGTLIRQVGESNASLLPEAGAPLRNCLLVDNTVSGNLIRAEEYSSSPLQLESCTIANNQIGGGSVVHYEDGLDLLDTLIYQPGKPTLDSNTALTAQYVLATDISMMPSAATIQLLGEPRFADAANGDYHLQLTSPAVDYAGGIGGTDLEGSPRDVDLSAHANAFGPRDLGAYERQSAFACDNAADALFCATFDP